MIGVDDSRRSPKAVDRPMGIACLGRSKTDAYVSGTWDREELVERSLTTLLVILLHVHLQRTYGPLIAFEHSYCMFGIVVLL